MKEKKIQMMDSARYHILKGFNFLNYLKLMQEKMNLGNISKFILKNLEITMLHKMI